jgi:hypothetical protein
VHADGGSGRGIADVVQAPAAEPGHRALPGRPLPEPEAADHGQGLVQVALGDRECAGRVAVIMESRVLAGEPAQQPDLIIVGEREPAEPAPVGEPDDWPPVPLGRCHRSREPAQLRSAEPGEIGAGCVARITTESLAWVGVKRRLGHLRSWLNEHPINPIGLIEF